MAHEIGVRIVAGELPEGSVLATEEIASRDYQVSRTAYREAIKVLTAKGMVESRQKVGTRIRPRLEWNMLDPDVLRWASEAGPSKDFIDSLFEFRMVVEPSAARMAAEKQLIGKISAIRIALEKMESLEPTSRENVDADLAFHSAVLTASGNELLCSLHHMAESLFEWSFEMSSIAADSRAASIPQHRLVFENIERGASIEAEQAMTALIKSARADIEVICGPDGNDVDPRAAI